MAKTATTKLVRVIDEIETGKYEINKNVGLTKVINLTIKAGNSDRQHNKKYYVVNVEATHPYFGKIPFKFDYIPSTGKSTSFVNAKDEGICMGTSPHGEIKDIVMSALDHESYAYQISTKKHAWLHAEQNAENGEYLIWHYVYYGIYSPRSTWKLPNRCETAEMWKKHKCRLCSGTKCKHLSYECTKCGAGTMYLCPVCKEPTCEKHTHCKSGHYRLTSKGMFEGKCRSCTRMVPIGERKCNSCGGTNIKHV